MSEPLTRSSKRPIVARAAGLIAHLAEEASNPIGFRMAAEAEDTIRYAGAAGGPRV